MDRVTELPPTTSHRLSILEPPESEFKPVETINFEGSSILHHQQLSLSDIKEENLLKPPHYMGRPSSHIFSPSGFTRSENVDSSPLLSRNVDNSEQRIDRHYITRLVECEVEIETVQVVREIV